MPHAVEDWFNRGVALAALGQHYESMKSFDRVVSLLVNYAFAHMHRAKGLVGDHAVTRQRWVQSTLL